MGGNLNTMRDFYFNIPARDRDFRRGALALGNNPNLTETLRALRRGSTLVVRLSMRDISSSSYIGSVNVSRTTERNSIF
jgi:hypothetical protein